MLPLKDDQPRYSTPYVNGFLIGLNVLIFLFQSMMGPRQADSFAHHFGVVPSHLAAFLRPAADHDFLAATTFRLGPRFYAT